ncbi:hypothetical protein B0H14DRAFT_176574 [Mycena olivaceomarginata]|nr:hypothetical protein B0H14DRAFT_176574 [Mycena olivaceomarginata]
MSFVPNWILVLPVDGDLSGECGVRRAPRSQCSETRRTHMVFIRCAGACPALSPRHIAHHRRCPGRARDCRPRFSCFGKQRRAPMGCDVRWRCLSECISFIWSSTWRSARPGALPAIDGLDADGARGVEEMDGVVGAAHTHRPTLRRCMHRRVTTRPPRACDEEDLSTHGCRT